MLFSSHPESRALLVSITPEFMKSKWTSVNYCRIFSNKFVNIYRGMYTDKKNKNHLVQSPIHSHEPSPQATSDWCMLGRADLYL